MILFRCREFRQFLFLSTSEYFNFKNNGSSINSETLIAFSFAGVVPKQAGEVSTERAQFDESRRLHEQRNGDGLAPASDKGAASFAACGEQRGILTEYTCYSGDGPVFLRRLLENDAAALRGGANRRDCQLSRLRRERRPRECRSITLSPSSGRHSSRVPRWNRREQPECPETASTSLRLDVSSDAREYVILFLEIRLLK